MVLKVRGLFKYKSLSIGKSRCFFVFKIKLQIITAFLSIKNHREKNHNTKYSKYDLCCEKYDQPYDDPQESTRQSLRGCPGSTIHRILLLRQLNIETSVPILLNVCKLLVIEKCFYSIGMLLQSMHKGFNFFPYLFSGMRDDAAVYILL